MNKYFEGFTEDYELNCGEKEFLVSKFEVYKLEINQKFNYPNFNC